MPAPSTVEMAAADRPTMSEMRALQMNSASTDMPCSVMPNQLVVVQGRRGEGGADLSGRVEQRVVGEERRQQRHGRRRTARMYEARHALPVRAVQAPDLAGVPDRELGALGIGGAPGPHGGARGPRRAASGTARRWLVSRPESEKCPVASPLAATNHAAQIAAPPMQHPGERRARRLARQLECAKAPQDEPHDRRDRRPGSWPRRPRRSRRAHGRGPCAAAGPWGR